MARKQVEENRLCEGNEVRREFNDFPAYALFSLPVGILAGLVISALAICLIGLLGWIGSALEDLSLNFFGSINQSGGMILIVCCIILSIVIGIVVSYFTEVRLVTTGRNVR